MRSRSSSRYITATLAPTNRNGRCPITKRPPCWRTNRSPGGLEATLGDTKKRTAALPTRRSAATTSSFLFIKASLISDALSGTRHSNKAHDGTDSAQHHEEIEECSDSQRHGE